MKLDIQPNPASSNAIVSLGLLRSEVVSILMTDIHGKEVRQILHEKPVESGEYTVAVKTDDLPNGSYIVIARTTDGRTVSTQLKVLK